MSGLTAKYSIPYIQSSDPVANAPTINQAQANRMDLMLGESGFFSYSPAAGATTNTAIVFGRTYPGNNAGVPGIVNVMLYGTIGASTFDWWVAGFTGSPTTLTGFTLGTKWSLVQASRIIVWRFLPTLS